jgi:acyl dehydratase
VTHTTPCEADQIVYAEDLVLDVPYPMGTYYLDREAVVTFAEAWDPQPFHLDEEVAATHGYGGLIASGLQTACIFQRLAVTGIYTNWAIIAGKAIREMSFHRAVRPDSTLTGSVTITDVVPRDEHRSLVHKLGRLWDEEGHPVFTIRAEAYMRRRPMDHPGARPTGADR